MKTFKIEIEPKLLHIKKVLKHFEDQNGIIHLSSTAKDVIDYSNLKNVILQLPFKPNIYAFYVKSKDSKVWELKYIGQRNSISFQDRMREHFSKHHEKTGSKLKFVNESIKGKKEIGVKLLSVQPEGLRKYYEEELISHFCETLEWNNQKGKGRSSRRKDILLK